MASTTILLNGFSIIGDPRTNSNASNGGELMIHDGEAVFESNDIIVLLAENADPDGSLNEDSIITGMIVYDNASDYYNDIPLYTYTTDPGDEVDVSDGRNFMGDTYLQIDASPLTSTDPGAPVLGDMTIAAGIDILTILENTNGPLEVAKFQNIDLDNDGIIDVGGDGQFSSDVSLLAVVCFARGTLIETPAGPRPVESLKEGTIVNTLDNGPQPLRWIGSRRIDASGEHAPICFQRGAMDNVRDLLVSPNHRMLVRGAQAELLFGLNEVLVAAKHLVNDTTIRPVPMREIEYFHFMTDQHDIVFAEACPSETLYPGQQSLAIVTDEEREEITALFPELELSDYSAQLIRPELSKYEAYAMVRRTA
ncbi:Hint domain-containing protein [Arenibacterium sp. CAU 1754]